LSGLIVTGCVRKTIGHVIQLKAHTWGTETLQDTTQDAMSDTAKGYSAHCCAAKGIIIYIVSIHFIL
jgi:hypothetical protein